jgi:hypothetical protein
MDSSPASPCAMDGPEAPARSAGRKPYKITRPREKWTEVEHERFVEAIERCASVTLETAAGELPRQIAVAKLPGPAGGVSSVPSRKVRHWWGTRLRSSLRPACGQKALKQRLEFRWRYDQRRGAGLADFVCEVAPVVPARIACPVPGWPTEGWGSCRGPFKFARCSRFAGLCERLTCMKWQLTVPRLRRFGRDWKRIVEHVGTRSVSQVRWFLRTTRVHGALRHSVGPCVAPSAEGRGSISLRTWLHDGIKVSGGAPRRRRLFTSRFEVPYLVVFEGEVADHLGLCRGEAGSDPRLDVGNFEGIIQPCCSLDGGQKLVTGDLSDQMQDVNMNDNALASQISLG